MTEIFALVQVYQDYDYVEGVKLLATFPTKQEGCDRIDEMQKERHATWLQKEAYVDDFVDKIEDPPDTTYLEWKAHLKENYPCLCGRYIMPKDFKKSLRQLLKGRYCNLEGFDPPIVKPDCNNLFVLKIK
jgi:hypothetical protein